MQSQVKPSHCCKQTPWLAQDSSVQVVLGPGRGRRREHPRSAKPPPAPGVMEALGPGQSPPSVLPGRKGQELMGVGVGELNDSWSWPGTVIRGRGRRQQGGQVTSDSPHTLSQCSGSRLHPGLRGRPPGPLVCLYSCPPAPRRVTPNSHAHTHHHSPSPPARCGAGRRR